MARKDRDIYAPDDLSGYSFKDRLLIRTIAFLLYWITNLIGKTLRFETEGWENFEKSNAGGKIPIYAFWHDRMFAGTYFFRDRKIVVMSSYSFDAEYTGRLIKRFGYGTVRGSSTKRSIASLVEMIKVIRKGMPVGFTMDGPKGPRYVAKAGACLLAKKTQNPIMPFVLEPKKFWEIGSWDRLQIPAPFTRVRVFIGEPLYVPDEAGDSDIVEEKRVELQKMLDELVKRGKQWRENEA